MATSRGDRAQLAPIQYLRGIAALMVVWHHSLGQISAYAPLLPISAAGANGVDIFFVISGFIMVLTTYKQQVTPKEFVRKRIIRIVPLYWIVLTAVISVALIFPAVLKTTVVTPLHATLSFLFVPHDSPSHPGKAWPLLVPGWTLNFEMFFYAIFAVAMIVRRNSEIFIIGLIFSILVQFGVILNELGYSGPVIFSYTHPMLLQFFFGGLLAYLFIEGRLNLNSRLANMILISGFVILVIDPVAPYKAWHTLGSVFILCGAICGRLFDFNSRVAKTIGDASYSIYLTHIPALGVARVLWVRLFDSNSCSICAYSFLIFAMMFCIFVGIIVFFTIERPLQNRLSGSFKYKLSKPP